MAEWQNLGANESSQESPGPSPALEMREIKSRGSILEKPALDEAKVGDVPAKPGAELPLTQQYTWDVVFVFKVGSKDNTVKVFSEEEQKHVKITEEEHFRNTTAEVVTRLEKAGLFTDMWYSVQKDEIYVRVGASEKRLQQEADRINYDLQLDAERCLEAGKVLDIQLAKVTEDDNAPDITENAWLNLYGKYDQLDPDHIYRQELYKRYNDTELGMRPNSFFTSIDRIKITVNIIEADAEIGGASVSMSKSIASAEHPMIAFFPLHEKKKRAALMSEWYDWKKAFDNPGDNIRAYFGESIALYFSFLAFYNRMLIMPAFLGAIIFIWQCADNRVDVEAIPAYAIIISVWATIFLELWKRRESQYRVRWGMTKFNEKEQTRPEFHGTWKPSPVDGHKIEYFPFIDKVIRALVAQSVIWTLIMVVIASVAGIFVLRVVLTNWNAVWGNYLTAFINAIQITVLNVVYGMVAFKLNDWENHRTDTEYMNALIAKTFLFKFVNSYNSLFYIAFIKRHDTDGCKGGCLFELAQQLGTIFVTSIVVNNTLEVLIPMIMIKVADYQNRTGAGGEQKKKSPPEEEFELTPYESTFDDFDELVIQYGYVTLFVVAFPLAPLLALGNNIIENRVDAMKLCELTRRPEPRGAYDIGTWSDILNIVSFIAVIVNMALIAFETDLLDTWTNNDSTAKAWVFIISEHVIIFAKFAIGYFVPDEPEAVFNHKARQEYIVSVLILGMEDENDDPEEAAAKGTVSRKIDFDWNNRLSDTIRFTGREW